VKNDRGTDAGPGCAGFDLDHHLAGLDVDGFTIVEDSSPRIISCDPAKA
jgi:hypothetical protein